MPRDHEEELDEWVDPRMRDWADRTWMPDGEVTNDEEAEWCLVQLRRCHRELERIQKAADAKRARIDAYQEQASVGPLSDVKDWEEKLIAYRHRLEAEDPQLRATYPLPSGVIKRVAGRDRIVVEDEKAFTDWALINAPGLLSLKPRLMEIKQTPKYQPITSLDDLKKTASKSATGAESQLVDFETGEQLPGVKIEVGPPTYSAKPT